MLLFKRRPGHPALHHAQASSIHQSEGYLAGQLLVSTPLLADSHFQQSVIYLFAHCEEGAMGIIVNQPMEWVGYDALLNDNTEDSRLSDDDLLVYYGGPVDRARGFVIHSDDYHTNEVIHHGDGISISANTTILKQIQQGLAPRRHLLAVGYAGWSAGQLEKEIEDNSWITVPATPELIFNLDDEMKWAMASQSLGIDMNFYSTSVGHA